LGSFFFFLEAPRREDELEYFDLPYFSPKAQLGGSSSSSPTVVGQNLFPIRNRGIVVTQQNK
jgi:hypothetical protein